MTSSFLVIGAGAWGTALAYELARKKHHVLLWTRHSEHAQALRLDRENKKYLPGYRFPTEIEITEDLIQAVQKVDRVLIAVPSHGFEEILAKIAPHFPKNKGILSSTKGLDPKSGRFLSELISDYLGKDSPQALLTGPSFATEIVRAFPTEVTLATNQLNFAHALKQELDHPHFHFKISEDLIGAQVGGAVKNVVSIVIGLAEGLGYGMNTKAMLITKGLAEMMSI
ncbi:MAG: NAD(P)H-dependent glycerol-3-phosphate dehydrogenase, partial [Gammaproteobacteria bacterium]|nr:NAD(P)H-dependent glycerol-3-phosphate dehydrogenase [Gammaproteobacteria bacterium]